MRYTVERLCADVMERLGETARPPFAPEGSDVPSPEDIVAMKVRSHLSEAGGKLISDAPAELLEGGAVISSVPAMRLMPSEMKSVPYCRLRYSQYFNPEILARA